MPKSSRIQLTQSPCGPCFVVVIRDIASCNEVKCPFALVLQLHGDHKVFTDKTVPKRVALQDDTLPYALSRNPHVESQVVQICFQMDLENLLSQFSRPGNVFFSLFSVDESCFELWHPIEHFIVRLESGNATSRCVWCQDSETVDRFSEIDETVDSFHEVLPLSIPVQLPAKKPKQPAMLEQMQSPATEAALDAYLRYQQTTRLVGLAEPIIDEESLMDEDCEGERAV